MARTSSAETLGSLKQAETDIAVLQVQVQNTNEKIDGVKVDLKDLREHIDTQTTINTELINKHQKSNSAFFTNIETKLSSLEKWSWMLMGGSAVLGAIGWAGLSKLLGM